MVRVNTYVMAVVQIMLKHLLLQQVGLLVLVLVMWVTRQVTTTPQALVHFQQAIIAEVTKAFPTTMLSAAMPYFGVLLRTMPMLPKKRLFITTPPTWAQATNISTEACRSVVSSTGRQEVIIYE